MSLLKIYIMNVVLSACAQEKHKTEHQITNDFSYNHDLDNNDNFSPDDKWLVYDTRTEEGGIGACGKIEKVNIETGEKVVMYALKENKAYGPGVGAVSYSHTDNQVVFIHGLMNITPENPYQQWRRTGVIVKDSDLGTPIFMDARDTSFPFTAGALRGGTHRHEWSGDGNWIGYTYNDAIMQQLEDSTGLPLNLRTIGVSKNIQPVFVNDINNRENVSGEWYSVLVVKVVPNPTPGSDEISRAAGDSWVGISGYKKPDGTTQRARAFIGTVKNKKGENIDEVFIVDIPEDITQSGALGMLEGDLTSMPSPPKGTQQRRLTFTADSLISGCQGIVRSSFDGSLLAFQAYDEKNIKQVYTISPLGGKPVQQTFHDNDVESGVRWHPSEHRFSYVCQNSIISRKIGEKEFDILTKPSNHPPADHVWSHDGEKIAYNRIVTNEKGESSKQIFVIHL
ncbi:DUF3748 domain-containing protein [Reichenbachiella sp. MALMAid0571]